MKAVEITKTNKQALVEDIAKVNTSGIANELIAEAVMVANDPNTVWTERSEEDMLAEIARLRA